MTLSSPKPQANHSLRGSRQPSARNLPAKKLQPKKLQPRVPNSIDQGYPKNQNRNDVAIQVKLPKQLPVKIERLLLAKQITRIVALGLISSVMYLYGSTVVMNNEWNIERQKLEKLQRSHREMTAVSESLNYGLAQGIQDGQQDKGNNYSREKPDKAVFLPSSPNTLSAITPENIESNNRLGKQNAILPELEKDIKFGINIGGSSIPNSLISNKDPLAY
jgi:hypothetical protein